MVYRDFQDKRLSALGFGAMRLPVIDGDDARPDKERVFTMVDTAMAKGINYYDTAWGYHNGNSEIVMGEALSRYPRETYYLAAKHALVLYIHLQILGSVLEGINLCLPSVGTISPVSG